MRLRRWVPAVVALSAIAAFVLSATLATADSFTPIRMTITINPVARLRQPLQVKVAVSADPGVLDGSEGGLRVGVKLADECGGTYDTTPGDQLLDKALSPTPTTGKSYSGSVSGSGKPTSYGLQTVCVFLRDAGVGRVYANDESMTVDVSKSCTTAASRYDSSEKALKSVQAGLRRTQRQAAHRRHKRKSAKDKRKSAKDKRTIARDKRTIAKDKRTANSDHSRARAACGGGVTLCRAGCSGWRERSC